MSNGYPRPKINNSRKILGFGVAPQQLGIGASFRYKDWNAGFLIEGKSGGQIFSGTNALLHGAGLHKNTIPAGGREAGFVPDGVMEDGTPVTVTFLNLVRLITGSIGIMQLRLVLPILTTLG